MATAETVKRMKCFMSVCLLTLLYGLKDALCSGKYESKDSAVGHQIIVNGGG